MIPSVQLRLHQPQNLRMLDIVDITPHPEHLVVTRPHWLEARRRVDDVRPAWFGPERVMVEVAVATISS